MTRSQLTLFVVVQFLFIFSSTRAEIFDIAPHDLQEVAHAILAERISRDGGAYYKRTLDYFQQIDDLTKFKLGIPIPHYRLNDDDIYRIGDDSTLKQSLELSDWRIPIFLEDNTNVPRTFLTMRRNGDGDWEYAGMGGDPNPLVRALDKWPIDEGYIHAEIAIRKVFFIAVEKDNELIFWFSNDNDEFGSRILGLTRSSDGSWPEMSQEYLVRIIHERWY